MHELSTHNKLLLQKEQKVAFKKLLKSSTSRKLHEYLRSFDFDKNKLEVFQNKTILLVGGGNSPIQKTFDELNINCKVTNVDPYIQNPDSANRIIEKDFIETSFENEFDFCWALYSLPLYSLTPEDAFKFYIKSAISLKPGGKLSILGSIRAGFKISVPAHEWEFHELKRLDKSLKIAFENNPIIKIGSKETWIAPNQDKDILNRFLATQKLIKTKQKEY